MTFALATEVLVSGDFARRNALFERAMTLREGVEDLPSRVVLGARNFATGSNWSVPNGSVLRRISEATQMLDHPAGVVDILPVAFAHSSRCWGAFSVRPQDRWTYVEAMTAYVDEHPDPLVKQILLVTRTEALLIDGRFDEVLASADEFRRIANVFENPDYGALADVLRLECIREQSGFAPWAEILVETLADLPGDDGPSVRAALRALVLAESGRLAEAAELITHRRSGDFNDIPDDASLAISLPSWSEAAAMVGDREACRTLLTLVERLDDCFFVTGAWFAGSTTRTRAILAAALGDENYADHLFEQAEVGFQEAQSPPWLARTRVDWAEQCLRLGNQARAHEFAAASLDAIGDLELNVTRSRAEAILAERGERS